VHTGVQQESPPDSRRILADPAQEGWEEGPPQQGAATAAGAGAGAGAGEVVDEAANRLSFTKAMTIKTGKAFKSEASLPGLKGRQVYSVAVTYFAIA